MFKYKNYKKLSNQEKNNSRIKEKYIDKYNFIKGYYMKKKRKKFLILIISLIIIIAAIFIFFYNNFLNNKKKKKEEKNIIFILPNKVNNNLTINKKLDYENEAFAIISRNDCSVCGLFSNYAILFGCFLKYLKLGYIPIIKLDPHGNIFKTHSSSPNINPWELLFNQPFGYTLEEVKKNAKNISEFSCVWNEMTPNEIPQNYLYVEFFRDMAKKYIPIKKEIIDESNIIWRQLFKDTKNVLGVLGRGTDFVQLKPHSHPIPPSIETMIKDVKKMDEKNKYDWIYLSTEDDNIRNSFIKEFGEKLKMVQNKTIGYKGGFIGDNENLQGIEFQKVYLLSIIILSKCIDVILARCNANLGVFLFSEGFRESKLYSLGHY